MFSTPLLTARSGLAVLIVTLGSIVLAGPFAAGDKAMIKEDANGVSICLLTARAAQLAARHEARADFWNDIASILNDPSLDLATAGTAAHGEFLELTNLTYDQFAARIDAGHLLGSEPYDPVIVPENFTADVTNPLHPLIPGRTLIYESQTSEGLIHIESTTLAETREIAGVECRVVQVIESLDGVVIEETLDWFAQDLSGNVWYFGEVTKCFEDGILDSLDGSWRAGKDDAKPGIVMLAAPVVGDAYRQEFLINVAEDYTTVVSVNETVSLPSGVTYTNCLETEDTTPVEPEERERKYYFPIVGLVRETDLNTGECLDLIQIIDN